MVTEMPHHSALRCVSGIRQNNAKPLISNGLRFIATCLPTAAWWVLFHKTKPHYYNYELMKLINGGKQMTDVWHLPAIARWEKSCGKHPTQKPLNLLVRIILASTEPNSWILDPFAGSSTTGIAASLTGRRFLGIEQDKIFLNLSKTRREEINDYALRASYCNKIKDMAFVPYQPVVCEDLSDGYGLPF